MSYFKNFFDTIKNYNLLFFTIIMIPFQLISISLSPYSIRIYDPATIMALYCFINLPITIYELIMSGIISTIVSYVIYKILIQISPKINVLLFNILTIFFVLTIMSIFNCIFMPALAYTLLSYVNIKQDTFDYLSSYIVATIIIVILCLMGFFIIKNIDKTIVSNISNLEQFENNIHFLKTIGSGHPEYKNRVENNEWGTKYI